MRSPNERIAGAVCGAACVRNSANVRRSALSSDRYEYDIFLSYSSAQERWVRWFASELRLASPERTAVKRVFFAQEDVHAGERFEDAIEAALQKSRYFVVLLSNESLSSKWVKDEVQLAHRLVNASKLERIIPVLLGPLGTSLSESFLGGWQARDLAGHDRKDQFSRLLKDIGVSQAFPLRTEAEVADFASALEPRSSDASYTMASAARGIRVAIYGLGYVGLCLAVALGKAGYEVFGIEAKSEKRELLSIGQSHFFEPGISARIEEVCRDRLFRVREVLRGPEVDVDLFVICLGPHVTERASDEGRSHTIWDHTHFDKILREVGEALRLRESTEPAKVIIAGTIRPEDYAFAQDVLRQSATETAQFELAAAPLFVREGSILEDLQRPPFIVTATRNGQHNAASQAWETALAKLAADGGLAVPKLCMEVGEASVLKLASNAFHAMKVCFANEVGRICQELKIDGRRVMETFVLDTTLNLSKSYLRPGFSFGGWCLQKDIQALQFTARDKGVKTPLLDAVVPSNDTHTLRAADLIRREAELVRTQSVALFGISFKEGTDDVRDSPTLQLVRLLHQTHQLFGFDRDLMQETELQGVNRQRWEKFRTTHAFSIHADPRSLLRQCPVIVLAKSNAISVDDLERWLPKSHVVIDLVGDLVNARLPGRRISRLT